MFRTVTIWFFICPLLVSQPLSQKQACAKFSPAVVRIDTGRPSHGTGFIIAPDGWVLTAAHVVVDSKTWQNDAAITVTLPDGKVEFATQVLPIDMNLAARDYAVLKINKPNLKLPYVELADKSEGTPLGFDATFIGFPFSTGVAQKFCLAGAITFSGPSDVTVTTGTQVRHVSVDVVYFQGPSVKGVSGSPLISRDTGHVIGIVSLKLTGISESLSTARNNLTDESSARISMSGVSLGQTIGDVIGVLDDQLANGLGAATGIEDAKFAFRQAQRKTGPHGK